MPEWIRNVVLAHDAALAASLVVFAAAVTALAVFRMHLRRSGVNKVLADVVALLGLALAYVFYRVGSVHVHNLFTAPFVICEFACDFPGFMGTRVYPALITAVIWFTTDERRLSLWRRIRPAV